MMYDFTISGKILETGMKFFTVHLRLHEEDEVASALRRICIQLVLLGFPYETAPFWCWRASFLNFNTVRSWRAAYFQIPHPLFHFPPYLP
jgi:hypothetical protein